METMTCQVCGHVREVHGSQACAMMDCGCELFVDAPPPPVFGQRGPTGSWATGTTAGQIVYPMPRPSIEPWTPPIERPLLGVKLGPGEGEAEHCNAFTPDEPRTLPGCDRCRPIVVDGLRRGLLTEGQAADLLATDRLTVREIEDDTDPFASLGPDDDAAQGLPSLRENARKAALARAAKLAGVTPESHAETERRRAAAKQAADAPYVSPIVEKLYTKAEVEALVDAATVVNPFDGLSAQQLARILYENNSHLVDGTSAAGPSGFPDRVAFDLLGLARFLLSFVRHPAAYLRDASGAAVDLPAAKPGQEAEPIGVAVEAEEWTGRCTVCDQPFTAKRVRLDHKVGCPSMCVPCYDAGDAETVAEMARRIETDEIGVAVDKGAPVRVVGPIGRLRYAYAPRLGDGPRDPGILPALAPAGDALELSAPTCPRCRSPYTVENPREPAASGECDGYCQRCYNDIPFGAEDATEKA